MTAFEAFVIGAMVGVGLACIVVAVTVWYYTPRWPR